MKRIAWILAMFLTTAVVSQLPTRAGSQEGGCSMSHCLVLTTCDSACTECTRSHCLKNPW
jgi:hypothetical protein